MNEVHPTQQEHGYPDNRYVVSILKDDLIVGHVPKEQSGTCWHFIPRDCDLHDYCTKTEGLEERCSCRDKVAQQRLLYISHAQPKNATCNLVS